MSPALTTFLYEAVNFAVLAAVLGWLFFPAVRRALERQRSNISEAAEQAEQKLAEAERLRAEAAAERKRLQSRLNELRANELEAARQQARQILADASATARRQRDTIVRQARQIAASESATLSRAAALAAAQMVAHLLTEIGGPDIDDALVEAASGQLQALAHNDLEPVNVESARALSPANCERIRQALGSTEPSAWQVVEELGAGVRISTAQGLIDATARGLASHAASQLMQHLDVGTLPAELAATSEATHE